VIGSFTPIAGILAAYFILGEVPTQAQSIGGSIILLGLVLSQVGVYYQTRRRSAMTKVTSVQAEQEIAAQMGFKGI
jgi:hypothetical protein